MMRFQLAEQDFEYQPNLPPTPGKCAPNGRTAWVSTFALNAIVPVESDPEYSHLYVDGVPGGFLVKADAAVIADRCNAADRLG